MKKSFIDYLKKLKGILSGMPFSIFIVALIIAMCVYGSLGHDWIYKSAGFLALAALLSLNLILCSISRFPQTLKRFKSSGCKRISIWGSWLTHFGMLMVIFGFALGQVLSTEYVVYGIAGSTQNIGNSGMTMTINSFDIDLRDDFTVDQYRAGLTIKNAKGESVSGEASVNHPISAFGFDFYQDSTGYANYVDIYHNGELEDTDLICVGEYTYPINQPNLVLMLNRFYPDLAQKDDGSMYSVTPLMNNPHSLYSIYYNNQVVDMNIAHMGSEIKAADYSFVLRDPVSYTLIVVRRDPTATFVGIAALIIIAGLFLSFYVKPYEEKKYHGTN